MRSDYALEADAAAQASSSIATATPTWVAIDTQTKQVLIGHRTASGLKIDATATKTLNAGVDYKLGVSIKGSSVSVTLNDQAAVGFVFNAVGVDGRFGLFTKGTSASFDSVSVQTNDPTFATAPAGSPLIAASLPLEVAGPVDVLTAEALRMVSDAAKYLWMESGVLTAAQRVALEHVEIGLGELGGLLLGVTVDGRITIDVDAGGHGWFVDPTPLRNEEFAWADTALVARNGTAADQRVDLLTTVAHEIGHAVGIEHDAPGSEAVMDEVIGLGVRRLPAASSVDTPRHVPSIDLRERLARGGDDILARHIVANDLPTIDLSVRSIGGRLAAILEVEGDSLRREKLTTFVNGLGRSGERNPNAGLKITLPITASVSATVRPAVTR